MTVSAAEQEKTGLGNYFIVSRTRGIVFRNPLRVRTCYLEWVAWME